MQTARDARKAAAAAELADADGALQIAGGYYTRDYLRARGAILKPLRVTRPEVGVLDGREQFDDRQQQFDIADIPKADAPLQINRIQL